MVIAKGRHLFINLIQFHFFSLSQCTLNLFCSFSLEIVPAFPVWVVVGIVTAVVLGLTLLITMILAVLYRRKNSKRDYTG